MNRTKILFRLTFAGSALFLVAAAVAYLVDGALGAQVALFALGTFSGLLSNHLRFRMVLSNQKATQRTLNSTLHRIADQNSLGKETDDAADGVSIATPLADILTALGDTQAAVAASESYLLAELTTLRQRILTLGISATQAMEAGVSSRKSVEELTALEHDQRRWTAGQFQQLRTQVEQLPSDAGEYAALRNSLIDEDILMPQLGGWVISSSTITSLVRHLLERKGQSTIVELGSGSSTLWLAHAVRSRGDGSHLHSLDHLEEYAERTRSLLAAHGLSDYATVHISPLAPLEIGTESFDWYNTKGLPEDVSIDILLVDGPPADTTHHARYPALPELAHRLADGALIYLDDTIRTDEKEVVVRWLEEFPSLSRAENLPKSTVMRWRSF